jgi:hypothetical protein
MATTLTKAARTVVSSSSNTDGSTTRGTLDLRTALGGFLTAKITNGATGPTVQCTCSLLVAHTASATPAAASAGADWKTVWSFGGGMTNNAITEQSWDIPPGVMHLEVEFAGNTGQTVTVEAFVSEVSSSVDA